ncbi:hypothetical protein EDB87DRAFT_1826474 [Lactarius vividus]|nr:hypothetical protein EDB87DRAFT_1826474 [Lactarius vividus]
MATSDIVFCTAKIAFQEAKADVTRYSIDLANKQARVVPALVYGSPKSDPESMSPESARISESLVLLEFVADLYPESGLFPKDPVERFFVDAVLTKVTPPTDAFFFRGKSPDALVVAVAEIQELLSPAAQFALGDHFTITDTAIAPFVARWELCNDVGEFAEGTGPHVHKELSQGERFARLQEYFANISSYESFKISLDPVHQSSPMAGGVYIGSDREIFWPTVNAKGGEVLERSSLYRHSTNEIFVQNLSDGAYTSVFANL